MFIAVGVNADARREVLGMKAGTSEAEPIWTEFLRKLTRRGLRGVKLVVSDAYEVIKAAVPRCCARRGRGCRVHFSEERVGHAGRAGAASSPRLRLGSARGRKHAVASLRRPDPTEGAAKVPKLATIMDDTFP